MELVNLKRKVELYKDVLSNTESYRKIWQTELKTMIVNLLQKIAEEVELAVKVEERVPMENLEAIVLSLGTVKSGMYQKIEHGIEVPLVKQSGSLIYQQLFNGKIIVLIQYPFIENYGQPRPPKTIAIYRPEELKEPYIVRHFEEFVHEITSWEDYDDDEPSKKIGFEMNFGHLKPEA
ncbi:MAG: hypothetical protein K9J37_07230 [Saprospiraceae bacterium]|nr:hypothetical protein [Saprospiraceae bacterium]MCF8249689.1 hypothetical protein [Saprospiraceae bacterium]MCF8279848.1 hypothetical protein [Bacteroidales bacterium]MCF8312324.1 hypothetical protein [Saprospiraceae bacterium]MCF8440679.1 hypothetical protein [Saprospiraceae bacterium]